MSALDFFDRITRRTQISPSGSFKKLKLALISDELTALCLQHECEIRNISPLNYRVVFRYWRPDILLVESAWYGKGNAWKFKIASYDGHPKRNNDELRRVVTCARDMGIPCVFWNKEDGVHFDRFIQSASLFDHIFTVDANALPRYREALGDAASVHPLMFAIQPALHSPANHGYRYSRACFVGSYSHHIHPRRRMWQDMLFEGTQQLGLTVYDRNSNRRSDVYRYPTRPWIDLRTQIPHRNTAQVYREHMVCLNVNTIEDSPTMFSRRFLEIVASGGLAVSTPALSIEQQFSDYCHIVSSSEELEDLLGALQNGWRPADKEMVQAGARHVLQFHTWEKRLEEILQIVPLRRGLG
ncbi:glycosyltransferase [Bordetella petrii]|uniref:CgeB family protein n=1 Tax=Bordetella petrii TaxID=94624 RepID=UPI0038B39621